MASLYKDFVLDGEIKFNSFGGRFEVSCGRLFLSFPEPEETDPSVWLKVDRSSDDINFRLFQPLCALAGRPRPPKTQEAGREALRSALREFAALLIHPSVSPGAPAGVLLALAGGSTLCPDCRGDGFSRSPETPHASCERCLGYGVNPRW